MPPETGDIAFSPVTAEHYPLLRSWLEEPHMRPWWGDPDEELGFIRDMVEGRDTTRPYVILLAGEPVGYIQCWHIGHHQNESWTRDNPWLAELPADAVGVDLSIGRRDLLSRGIGTAALTAFTAMLRREGHATIVIDPDPDNGRAVRAYEKAGYRPIPELVGRTPGVLLMRHSTEPKEAAT